MQVFGNVWGNNSRPIFEGKWKISSGANQNGEQMRGRVLNSVFPNNLSTQPTKKAE